MSGVWRRNSSCRRNVVSFPIHAASRHGWGTRLFVAVSKLQVIDTVCSEDEAQGDDCDGDLAEGADDEGAGALFEEIA